MDSVESWRGSADAQLTPLQEVKDQLRKTRLELDAAFPEWRAAYDADPAGYPRHDARREFFVTLQLTLTNAQLSYTFMKDQLCDTQWWVDRVGEHRPVMVEQALREYALMVKFFTVHATATATEETLRAIVRAGPPFTCPETAAFASVVAHVLKVTELQELAPLFELIRLVRNTIHNNGVHRTQSGKDDTVIYAGRKFEFMHGQQLTWMGEDFLSWLPKQLNEAMSRIVQSDPVSGLTACPRL